MPRHGFDGNLHRAFCMWHNERMNSIENSYFHIIAFSEIVFMLFVVSIITPRRSLDEKDFLSLRS